MNKTKELLAKLTEIENELYACGTYLAYQTEKPKLGKLSGIIKYTSWILEDLKEIMEEEA